MSRALGTASKSISVAWCVRRLHVLGALLYKYCLGKGRGTGHWANISGVQRPRSVALP